MPREGPPRPFYVPSIYLPAPKVKPCPLCTFRCPFCGVRGCSRHFVHLHS